MALHMSTIISRTASDILSQLSYIRPALSSHIPLFSISVSPNTKADELSALVSHLTSQSSHGIGCLSASIPSTDPTWQESIACSVALFDKSMATPFRSTIPGINTPQVGRWHSFRKRSEDADDELGDTANINWDDIWSRKLGRGFLPPEIPTQDHEAVGTIVYFSDGAPEGLSNALHTLGSATKVGLIASSTPFVTGRPFTLFHGTSIYSSGAVGLYLASSARPRSYVEFPGLQKLTEPLTVTSSKGNLVHSLDNTNPSRLLLSAIEKSGSASRRVTVRAPDANMKDDQYYLAALRRVGEQYELHQLFTIMSGDPSRGTLALGSDTAPSEGTPVQIYRLPAEFSPDTLARYLVDSKTSAPRKTCNVIFTVSPDVDHRSVPVVINESMETIVLDDVFIAASENGFVVDDRVLGDGGDRPWRCTIRGGLFGLEWDR
ncbi:hypothetical protein BKA93DRAFT_903767 [Sparassis latifolia]|uniref:FIST domain-containing protein n=1 Tax=Sparassis crispa TaxID=139825 RepID=A0A401GSP9_9APHY|nr:hypothetical protein SCP_0704390 [Sparassis crispa]GBE85252.1 hypothetical protein SCP_0704390 [Sparassis crispa]